MSNIVRKFEDLTCWKEARMLKNIFYDLAKSLPKDERFALSDQIRRSAVSLTANIAEGYGRFNYKEKIQFTRVSRASLYELKDHLYTCLDQKYISQLEFDALYGACEKVGKAINGYIGYLNREMASE